MILLLGSDGRQPQRIEHHQQGTQGHTQASQPGRQPTEYRQGHANRVVSGSPPKILSHHSKGSARHLKAARNGTDLLAQHDEIGLRLRQGSSPPKGEGNMGASKYRPVVESISHYRHPLAALLGKPQELEFVQGRAKTLKFRDANLGSDASCSLCSIAR